MPSCVSWIAGWRTLLWTRSQMPSKRRRLPSTTWCTPLLPRPPPPPHTARGYTHTHTHTHTHSRCFFSRVCSEILILSMRLIDIFFEGFDQLYFWFDWLYLPPSLPPCSPPAPCPPRTRRTPSAASQSRWPCSDGTHAGSARWLPMLLRALPTPNVKHECYYSVQSFCIMSLCVIP